MGENHGRVIDGHVCCILQKSRTFIFADLAPIERKAVQLSVVIDLPIAGRIDIVKEVRLLVYACLIQLLEYLRTYLGFLGVGSEHTLLKGSLASSPAESTQADQAA